MPTISKPCNGECGKTVTLDLPEGPGTAFARTVIEQHGLLCDRCQANQGAAEAEALREAAHGKLQEAWHKSIVASGVPPLKPEFEWPDGLPTARARQWINREVKTLVLTGGVGTGKTQLAIAAFRQRLKPTVQASGAVYAPQGAWRSASGLSLSLGASFGSDEKNDAIELASRARVLVLDDLDKARGTEFVGEALFALIDAAIVNEQSLLVTSNATVNQLKERWPGSIGHAIADRLAEGAVLNFTGASRRRPSNTNRKAA